MAKIKLNGTARWIIVGLAVLALVFNSGVTYNHIYHLSEQVKKLTVAIDEMDKSIDKINITLAKGENK